MSRIPKRVHKKVQDYEKRIEELRKELADLDIKDWEENFRKRNHIQKRKMTELLKYKKRR